MCGDSPCARLGAAFSSAFSIILRTRWVRLSAESVKEAHRARPNGWPIFKSRKIRILAALGVLVPVTVLASWMVTESIIEETSGVAFCGGCHTMGPMVKAYQADIHGGAGEQGVKAKCSQCHIPHDNVANYILTKTRFGMHDAWAQLTYDLDDIDWQAKRAHRESFVFDSGCLSCHKDLQRATERNAAAFVAHRPYFLGVIEKKCVSCHQYVGHSELARHLPNTDDGEALQ